MLKSNGLIQTQSPSPEDQQSTFLKSNETI